MRKIIFTLVLFAGVGVTSTSRANLPERKIYFKTSCGTITYSNAGFYKDEKELKEALDLLEEIDCGKKHLQDPKLTAVEEEPSFEEFVY